MQKRNEPKEMTYPDTRKVKYICEVGQKFGHLTVVRATNKKPDGRKVFICECVCGNIKKVSRHNLVSGCTNSCGCRGTAYPLYNG